MNGPIVLSATTHGGVLRTKHFADGTQLQCTAGPFHFDAFVKPDKDWVDVVLTSAACSTKPDKPPSSIGMSVTGEFSDLLKDFFGMVSRELECYKQVRPEAQIGQAYEEAGVAEKRMFDAESGLRVAEAEIERLKAENKAIRSKKRRPRADKS